MRRWDHALSHCYVSRNFKMIIPISLKCTKLQIYSKAHLAEHITSVSFLWNRRIPLYYQYLHSSPNHYILIRSFLTVTLRFISIVAIEVPIADFHIWLLIPDFILKPTLLTVWGALMSKTGFFVKSDKQTNKNEMFSGTGM